MICFSSQLTTGVDPEFPSAGDEEAEGVKVRVGDEVVQRGGDLMKGVGGATCLGVFQRCKVVEEAGVDGEDVVRWLVGL